ncbi:hypothetical protein [Sphingobium naphthae]|uniref:Uncharacterized protein n=1 Tax=Sphingobium naphthae TaxID=1886786 RepID=A0ABU3ZZ41_9SPHN|nr:hypothetical protein [Sphingobium naphthae]MDV5824790.1 hypothetical protein [Sphingobium naphthae]
MNREEAVRQSLGTEAEQLHEVRVWTQVKVSMKRRFVNPQWQDWDEPFIFKDVSTSTW